MNRYEAFSKYNAKLKNFIWSVSAENDSGELVLSLWKQYFQPVKNGTITYKDKATRWSGLGNNEFRSFLNEAYKNNQVIRAVIGRTSDEGAVARGEDASKLDNTFHVREDWLGVVTVWNEDDFEIEFRAK
jgi:hypothetical protein